MKTGLTLSAFAVVCMAASHAGPCPDAFWFAGFFSGLVGWLVSLTSLGLVIAWSARDVKLPALAAIFFTAAIIWLGKGRAWDLFEPQSWILVGVFFVVPLTLAGVQVRRWRKH